MRYSEEPYPALARAWRPARNRFTEREPPAALGPASPHRSRPAPSRHSRFTPHVGATAAGQPRTPHRAHLAYSTALKLSLGPRNKKSAQTATFLRLRIVEERQIADRGPKTRQIDLFGGSFPPCGDARASAIAKKLQKKADFCFCGVNCRNRSRFP